MVLATKRLDHLQKRFALDKRYQRHLSEFMEDIIERGQAEISPKTTETEERVLLYIPHHGVYHHKKPDKIRVVFDCSAKFQGVSLNDILLQGADLTNNLLGVLCKEDLDMTTDPLPQILNSDPEMKRKVLVTNARSQDSLSERFSYFSDWRRLKKAIAHCQHYVRILKSKVENETLVKITDMAVDDLQRAEITIMKLVQEDAFEELCKVSSTKPHDKLVNLQRNHPLYS
jgi:hypothetical protein